MTSADPSVGGRTIAYVPALDGLRAWAVVAVVLYHAGATSALPGLAPGGFLGVSVFFTLSGYLVTTLLIRQSEDGRFDASTFWSRRIRRLVPVSLVVVLGAVLAASTYWAGMLPSDAAAGLFGYTNWHVIASGEDALLRTIVGPLGPYWSLAVEEQFYVLLTLAVVVSWRTARPLRTLAVIVGVGWSASLAVQVFVSGPQYRLEFGTDSRGAELLAGCGLALLLHHRSHLLEAWRTVLAVAGPIAFLLIGVLAATTDYDPPWLLHGGYAALSLVNAVLVASLLGTGPLPRLLARRPFVVAGRLSYSWYVVHWPVILVVDAEVDGLDRWPLVAVKVIASFLAAALLHVTVEQPLRRAGARPAVIVGAWLGTAAAVLALSFAVLGG